MARRVRPGESIGAARGDVVVCVPVFGQHELVARCLASVLAHTPPGVAIVVADDASPDGATERHVEALDDPRLVYLRQPENVGFPANVNTAFAAAAPADVVILNSDCEVGPEWLERLHDSAYSDSLIATATALSNHGSIASVSRGGPTAHLPPGQTAASVATCVAATSQRLRPRVITAVGHCMYVKRSALDLVGDFDLAFTPGYGEEVDFSQRCVLRGLTHVLADDVFVYHRGGSSFGSNRVQEDHERIVARRYPYYLSAVVATERRSVGPLPRALDIARAAIDGLSVTIDARCLGPTITGTQIHVLELIHALHRTGRVAALRAVVPSGIGPWFLDSLRTLDGLELLVADDLADIDDEDLERSAIVHRPYQVFDVLELELIARLGDRFVVTHQDLISYRNPGYSRSFEDWNEFHRLTRLTLAVADQVLFFSEHARADALAEELVDPDRAHVAHLGVDHRAAPAEEAAVRPDGVPEGQPFLLCIGTNFRHKNRVFALDIQRELRERHEWRGLLVFAGPHAAGGTSERDERAWLRAHEAVADSIVDVGEVTDGEKRWLFENTRGVVYPSVYEGFGLVPFEAAAHGAPCFFAWQTALRETAPESAALIEPWDAAVTAERIATTLGDPREAERVVAAVAEAGSRLSWDATAETVVSVYELAVSSPSRSVVQLAGDVGSPAALGARLSGRRLQSVDLPESVYRSLRALVARPALRIPLFAVLRMIYMAGHIVRKGRLPERVV